jgi:hypothetical protein
MTSKSENYTRDREQVIPMFASPEEEAEFWDTHEGSQLIKVCEGAFSERVWEWAKVLVEREKKRCGCGSFADCSASTKRESLFLL